MKKNIAMIAYSSYSIDGRVIREAEAAIAGGYEVDCFTLMRKGDLINENIRGVKVIRLPHYRYRGDSNSRYMLSYFSFFLKCFFRITWNHFKKNYRVIHVNNMPDFYVFIALIPKLFGCKVILDIHDPMPTTFITKFGSTKNSLKYKLLLWQEQISAWFAHAVVTVHEPVKMDILVKDGIPENKITVIANFADDTLFKLKENYKLDGKIKLIFHGTIAERFGLQNVLQVFAQLPDKDRFYFKIIGEGDYSGQVKKIISDLKLEGIVDFDNNFYPVTQLPKMVAQYDVGLVCYSLSAATEYMLPLKMLEYVALGLPVITLPNKAINFYFCKEDCFFYDPNNLSSLREILEQMAKNQEMLYKKRESIITLREKFLWSGERQKYINLLDSLVNS